MRHLHTKLQLSSLKNKKVEKPVQSARLAVQNVHCAHPISQKNSIRMFTTSKFTPVNQIMAF